MGDQEWAEPEGESQVSSVLQQGIVDKARQDGFRRWKTPSLGPEKPALRCDYQIRREC